MKRKDKKKYFTLLIFNYYNFIQVLVKFLLRLIITFG